MPERWTPEELNKYKHVIKAASKSREAAKTKSNRELDKLFNKLHPRKQKGNERWLIKKYITLVNMHEISEGLRPVVD